MKDKELFFLTKVYKFGTKVTRSLLARLYPFEIEAILTAVLNRVSHSLAKMGVGCRV